MLNFNKYSSANVEIKVEFVMVSENSLCGFVGSMHVSWNDTKLPAEIATKHPKIAGSL